MSAHNNLNSLCTHRRTKHPSDGGCECFKGYGGDGKFGGVGGQRDHNVKMGKDEDDSDD